MVVPKQQRGSSKQDYETPDNFILAVKRKFGPLDIDLAASESNSKGKIHLGEERNSLIQDWSNLFASHTMWLNPPFANITPWAKKCSEYSGRGKVLFLTPASVGADWFVNYVHDAARVYLLNGRLKFVGAKDYYPKDCILSVFSNDVKPGYEVWNWRK